jgi:hypothetical protein
LKKIKQLLLVLSVLMFISFIVLVAMRIYQHQTNFDRFPEQKYIKTVQSPYGNLEIRCYLISPPMSQDLVKASLFNRETGEERSFYLEFGEEIRVKWIDKTHVEVNGLEMNVLKDKHY